MFPPPAPVPERGVHVRRSLRSMTTEPLDTPDGSVPTIDLDQVAADLADVEVALARLDAGTYWTDEVTGEPLADEFLAEHPVARRAPAA